MLEHKSGNICDMRKMEEKLLWIGGPRETQQLAPSLLFPHYFFSQKSKNNNE